MSVVQAFNNLLAQLVGELGKVFPHDVHIKTYKNTLALLLKSNPHTKLALKAFREWIGDATRLVEAKDDALFDERPCFLHEIELGKLWRHGLSHANKDVMWQYLHGLVLLSDQEASAGADTPDTPSDTLISTVAESLMQNPGQLQTVLSNKEELLKLVAHISPEEVLSVVPVDDPMELLDIIKGGIDPVEIMDLFSNFSPQKMLRLSSRLDQDKLMDLAARVDQQKLLALVSKVDQEKLLATVQNILNK